MRQLEVHCQARRQPSVRHRRTRRHKMKLEFLALQPFTGAAERRGLAGRQAFPARDKALRARSATEPRRSGDASPGFAESDRPSAKPWTSNEEA